MPNEKLIVSFLCIPKFTKPNENLICIQSKISGEIVSVKIGLNSTVFQAKKIFPANRLSRFRSDKFSPNFWLKFSTHQTKPKFSNYYSEIFHPFNCAQYKIDQVKDDTISNNSLLKAKFVLSNFFCISFNTRQRKYILISSGTMMNRWSEE